jgi:hypothetical protein
VGGVEKPVPSLAFSPSAEPDAYWLKEQPEVCWLNKSHHGSGLNKALQAVG